MAHAFTADGLSAEATRIPADLRIPTRPVRVRFTIGHPEPRWRQAMRWALIGLTASWAAGEITLLLVLP